MAKKKRAAEVKRETKETKIRAALCLDGEGKITIKTPFGFLDHMLTAMSKHAHHTVEDIGLVLGEVLSKALGDKSGITRFGEARVPMDEALASAAIDVSGRPLLVYDAQIPERKQWEFDCNLVKEFFQGLAAAAKITLHLKLEAGDNYHHSCEVLFKAAGRALRMAVALDPRVKGVPSSKGTIG
jgi:imidazoleglycerol-phosphate dehydratase